MNMQGDGRLRVESDGRLVFNISNSSGYLTRSDLPKANASYVPHSVLLYEPGEWEKRVTELASSIPS